MDSVFKGSFLQFDITPNVSKTNPAFLQGMAGGIRQSTAVAIPLSIEMCMLEDSNFTKLLFVTADILGFDKMVVDEVRRHAGLWGIEPGGIVLNASHTHYAPGTVSNMPDAMGPFYENYSGQILKLIVTNLRKLYDSLEPCKLSCGKAETQIGVNRRYMKGDDVYFAPNPEGAYIKDTPLLKIVLKSSGREIIWVSHGCHPTGMGVDTRISSDYPGFMKYELRRNSIADGVMFFQGAGGSSKQAFKKNGQWKFCDNINDVRQNGFKLASIVKESVFAGLVQIKGQFYSKLRSIDLPLSATGETDKINKSSPTLPTEVQLVCIGDDFRMLTFPMEPVAEFAQKIQACKGVATKDFLLGYTNGLDGYLVDDSMIEAGGYEVEKSHLVYKKPAPLAVGTERIVIDSIRTLLEEQDNVDSDNGYGRYHRTKNPKKSVFRALFRTLWHHDTCAFTGYSQQCQGVAPSATGSDTRGPACLVGEDRSPKNVLEIKKIGDYEKLGPGIDPWGNRFADDSVLRHYCRRNPRFEIYHSGPGSEKFRSIRYEARLLSRTSVGYWSAEAGDRQQRR